VHFAGFAPAKRKIDIALGVSRILEKIYKKIIDYNNFGTFGN